MSTVKSTVLKQVNAGLGILTDADSLRLNESVQPVQHLLLGVPKIVSIAGNATHQVPAGKRWVLSAAAYTAAGIVAAPGPVFKLNAIAFWAPNAATVAAYVYMVPLGAGVHLNSGDSCVWTNGEATGANTIVYQEFDA